MKKTLYILVILVCAFLQSNSTFSFEYSAESNALITDVMEELDLIMNDRIIQNRVSKFSNGVVAKDSEIRNMYIDLSHIISDYLDAENRMFHVATIGKLLVGLVTIIGTIIINQIKLIINLI